MSKGVAAVVVSIAGAGAFASAATAAVTAMPSSIDFGKQKVGSQSSPQIVSIRGGVCTDVDGDPGPPWVPTPLCFFEPMDVAVAGPFSILSNSCPAMLAGQLGPGGCTVSVAFNPPSRGEHEGFLRLQSSPMAHGVLLSGKGCKETKAKAKAKAKTKRGRKLVCREKRGRKRKR